MYWTNWTRNVECLTVHKSCFINQCPTLYVPSYLATGQCTSIVVSPYYDLFTSTISADYPGKCKCNITIKNEFGRSVQKDHRRNVKYFQTNYVCKGMNKKNMHIFDKAYLEKKLPKRQIHPTLNNSGPRRHTDIFYNISLICQQLNCQSGSPV